MQIATGATRLDSGLDDFLSDVKSGGRTACGEQGRAKAQQVERNFRGMSSEIEDALKNRRIGSRWIAYSRSSDHALFPALARLNRDIKAMAVDDIIGPQKRAAGLGQTERKGTRVERRWSQQVEGQIQPAPTLMPDLKPDREAWVWDCLQTCDDGCRFPATISIGSMFCVRAPGVRPA